MLGIVLNGCDNADMDPYYAYGYGYGYTGKKGKGGPGSGVFSPSARHDPEYVAPTNGNGNGNGNGAFDQAPGPDGDTAATPASWSPTQPD